MMQLSNRPYRSLARSISVLALISSFAAAPALAQNLRIGLASGPTSTDPHFHANGTNIALTGHVFEGLTWKDENMRPHPSLAESWEYVDENTWVFRLREGVTFHDGSPFTTDDVIFTFERVPSIVESPSPFTARLADVESYRAIDDHTLEIKTRGAAPNLPINLADVQIVSRAVGEGSTTQDYLRGDAMIGTGPYRYLRGSVGEIYEFARNEDYWGESAPWETLTHRIINSDPARVAALLAGNVDLINDVPATDVPMLETNADIMLWSTPTNRVVFVALDVENETPIPGQATDLAGNALPENPMLDRRVRKALSMAIDRVGLADRGLSQSAFAASQIVPEGIFGYNPEIGIEEYDPEGARALLAEAGYPDGFALVLSTSNNDTQRARAAQAIGQMWTRVGVRTELDLMPHSVFIPRTNDFELSHMIHSWGTSTGEAAYTLRGIAGTRDRDAGSGTSNRGRYSNPEVDALVAEASATADPEAREALLQQAMWIVMREDYGLLPLYSPRATWASTATMEYVPSMANMTSALFATPKP